MKPLRIYLAGPIDGCTIAVVSPDERTIAHPFVNQPGKVFNSRKLAFDFVRSLLDLDTEISESSTYA